MQDYNQEFIAHMLNTIYADSGFHVEPYQINSEVIDVGYKMAQQIF